VTKENLHISRTRLKKTVAMFSVQKMYTFDRKKIIVKEKQKSRSVKLSYRIRGS